MRSPYRQDLNERSPVKTFGKMAGKHLASDLIGEVSPMAGKLASLAGKAQYAATNAADFGLASGSKLLGKAGGGLASILVDPSEIANDPMEGPYGDMLRSEHNYRNRDIELGDAMGPPTPAENIRKIVDAEMNEGQNRAEIARKKKAEQSAFGISQLIGLLSNMGGGIR